jgi:hypothetical protein
MSAEFLLGFTAAGCLVVSLFFFRFWRASADRFFALMGLAFAIFGANRLALSFLEEDSEARPVVYLVRLLAFLVIVAAILDRNKRA